MWFLLIWLFSGLAVALVVRLICGEKAPLIVYFLCTICGFATIVVAIILILILMEV
jgi:hypothetical protein